MSVNQAFVDSLAIKIESELFAVADHFAVNANNGIENFKIAKDIVRLNNLLKILEDYDVTADYYDSSYLLSIETEYSNHCGYKKPTTISFTAGVGGNETTTIGKEVVYEHTATIAITTDNGDTGIDLDATPNSALDVYIQGVPMMIGDGVKTKDVYFSGDGGVTARTITNFVIGDRLYYNAVIIGADLDIGDFIRFEVL